MNFVHWEILILGLRGYIIAIIFYAIVVLRAKQFVNGIIEVIIPKNIRKISSSDFQRDYKKMRIYLFYLFLEAVIFLLLALLFLYWKFLEFSENDMELDKKQESDSLTKMLLTSAIATGLQIYIFLCIMSLFLNIRDENLNSGRAGNDNVVSTNECQKPANDVPQPPPYQPDDTSQVVINMN